MTNLLQIHEPGETPAPHSATRAVGIDLGTTHSVVSIVHEGVATPIEDAQGRMIVPSIVQYTADGVVVGHAAAQAYRAGAVDCIASVKRLMGKSAGDVESVAGQVAYRFAPEQSGLVRLTVANRTVTPVEVSAEILGYLRNMAEEALGEEVTQAVITVPAYFDDAARAATKDAARIAGLTVLRLINEPTAAALSYGLDHASEGIYAIYDLGGGTFDISILKLQAGVFQVLATAGDAQLGGDDVDRALAEDLIRQAGASAEGLTPAQLGELLSLSRCVKEQLSAAETATLHWQNRDFVFTRRQLEALMQPLIARSLRCCEAALVDAGIETHAVQGVVLVGGSTRIPYVKQQVESLFGKPPLDDLDPDLVVSLGAAIQAQALTLGADHLLLDVTALSLGLETMGGIVEKLIQRNTPIPVSVSQEFTTYQDGQMAMKIHVLQGEREQVADCRSLAEFTLRGIPPMVAGAARIHITFAMDADGLLTVSAEERLTGIAQQIEVKPAYGLAFEEIERMVVAGMEHAREDILTRLLIEARVEASRLVAEVRAAMVTSAPLLKPGEDSMIESQIMRLEKAAVGVNRERIDHETHQLNALVTPFAQRRMDAAMASALAGRNVDEVE